jgi:uncharacterized protein (TIGR02117 family)
MALSKRILLVVLKSLGIFVAVLIVYAGIVWCLSQISNGKAKRSDEPVSIWVNSNGVHLDLIVPTITDQQDWRTVFPMAHNKGNMGGDYIAFGWGDKGFYLETPTWADLKASTAFKAAFGLSSSALHVTYHPTITETDQCIKTTISRADYDAIIAFILESIDRNDAGEAVLIPTNAVYSDRDAFYEATGSYSLFQTCNTWTNRALHKAGAPACLFTLFSGAVMDKYR